jgi:N-acetyl-alpha-D-muramate 1-phosphate uridylyltransferase
MNLPVAILAGGLATRLRPLTERIPKVLIDVAGEPFAHHQLRLLAHNGIRRAVYCLGYLGEQVVDAIGDGSRFGLEVSYVFDGEQLMGTGGALIGALPELGERFFVLYGDSYLDIDYQAVAAAHAATTQPALMTIYANAGRWDTSNVEFADGRIIRYSKKHRNERMRHIDYGLGVVHRSIFDDLPRHIAIDLASIYEDLADNGQLAGFEVFRRFYEIGSFVGITELRSYLAEKGDA